VFLATTAIVYTFVVSQNLYGRRLQRVLASFFRTTAIVYTFVTQKISAAATCPLPGAIRLRTAREINPSHSNSYQPSQQELSAFNTAGGSIVPRHSTSNYPSTSKRNQSSPSKRNQPSHSRCNEPSPSRRIPSSPTGDSFSQLGCRPRRLDNHWPNQRVAVVLQ